MLATLLELLKETHPEAIKNWDGWHYRVIGPISLDDPPVVQVRLENKNKTVIQVGLDLAGAID